MPLLACETRNAKMGSPIKSVCALNGVMKALFDTNILIDYLNGIDAARQEIARYEYASFSLITWMEVLVGTAAEEEPIVREFLHRFQVRCSLSIKPSSNKRLNCAKFAALNAPMLLCRYPFTPPT